MRKRQGFTLIELMVVMAIILIIMVILSRAFGDSLATLRRAKGIGDLQDKLRTATSILRRDLSADHFDGRRRVSDWRYDWAEPAQFPKSNIPPPPRRKANPELPREGYFLLATGAIDANEGSDSDDLPSRRVTSATLTFTVKLRGNEPKNFFSAKIPPGSPLRLAGSSFVGLPSDARFQDPASTDTYSSQWAVVRYYLSPALDSQNLQDTTAGPMMPSLIVAPILPLYALYRQQAVLVADNTSFNNLVSNAQASIYNEFSVSPGKTGTLHFNTPSDKSAAGIDASNPGALLINDVISFEAVILSRESWNYWGTNSYSSEGPGIVCHKPENSPNFNPYAPLTSRGPTDQGADWWNTPGGPRGWLSNVPADGIRITIRVWDTKTNQARQITIFQDL